MDIPIIRGKIPAPGDGEYGEMKHYASGGAQADADLVGGAAAEPWIEVIKKYEPSAFPATERLLAHDKLRALIKGTVIDVGAGTCFLTARISQLPAVDHVYAIDMSEEFLTSTGARILKHFQAAAGKVTFVASDFNAIPLPDASADTAFIFAAIHHSLSPIKTLQEVARVVRPGGTIFILENPVSVLKIRHVRRYLLSLSRTGNVTEIAYTRGELEYVIDNAKIGDWTAHTWDVLGRPGIRRWIRHLFRALKLEDILLSPPNYLFVIKRA